MSDVYRVKVWDGFVRLFHWTVVLGFAICYITEGKPRWLHVNSGYVIAALVAIRVIWGFVGPKHARFSDFVRDPKSVLNHLKEVATFRPKRYLGHDPAGGAMIVILLLMLALTTLSGMWLHALKDKAGPFSGWAAIGIQDLARVWDDHPAYASKGESDWGGETKAKDPRAKQIKEVHETFANISLVLVCIHICGVLLVSYQTRENLILSMVTGRKDSLDQ